MRHSGPLSVATFALILASFALAQGFVPGDVNDDQSVDILDATVLRRALAELEPGISQTCELPCGNGVLDPGEECELGTLAGQTCATLGFDFGTLGCTPGSCLFDTSACQESCAPLNPEPVCGSGHHCFPQPDNQPICVPGIGAGTNGSACTSDANCAAIYACITAGSSVCRRWCFLGVSGSCPGAAMCTSLGTPLFAGGFEYGVCI